MLNVCESSENLSHGLSSKSKKPKQKAKEEKMKKIVFATNNLHKLEEIRQILGSSMEVVSLADIGCHADIPETADTLEGNALQKAQYVWDHYHMSVFADDTGLEVDALDGAPGVHSARYAEGTDHNSEANMEKLLRELNGKTSRTAHFRTVIALLLAEDGNEAEAAKDEEAANSAEAAKAPCTTPKEHLFEGRVDGTIATEKRGTAGFGYDPLFVPDGYDQSFAQLGTDIKNTISHRARAVEKLCCFLKQTDSKEL